MQLVCPGSSECSGISRIIEVDILSSNNKTYDNISTTTIKI